MPQPIKNTVGIVRTKFKPEHISIDLQKVEDLIQGCDCKRDDYGIAEGYFEITVVYKEMK